MDSNDVHELINNSELTEERLRFIREVFKHNNRMSFLWWFTVSIFFLLWISSGLWTALLLPKEKPCICGSVINKVKT